MCGMPSPASLRERLALVANGRRHSFEEKPMSNMTYREFKAAFDQLNRQMRELRDRTTASSLAALSDAAFEEEVRYFLYLDSKAKRLRTALDAVPRAASNSTS